MAWTERDITASRAGRVVFSARRITDAEYGRMQGDHDEEVPHLRLGARARPDAEHEAHRAAEGESAYSLGNEFPTEFALHHVEHGRVALRFSLGHSFEVCRGMMIQIGVLVPASARWEAAVRAADARRSGYLMKDVARIAGNRGTVLRYRPDR